MKWKVCESLDLEEWNFDELAESRSDWLTRRRIILNYFFFFPNLWQLIKFNWLGFVVNVPIIFTTLYTGKEVKWFQQWVKIRINKNLSHMICYESIMKMLWLTTNYLDGCEIFVSAKSLYLEKLELITTYYLWFIFLQHFHNKY